MGKTLKQHLKPFVEDCKEYMDQLYMFENLKVGTWLSGGFGDRKDVYGLVTNIVTQKEKIVIDLDFYNITNSLERFQYTTLMISKTYGVNWRHQLGYAVDEFKVIKNHKMFKVLYGPKV